MTTDKVEHVLEVGDETPTRRSAVIFAFKAAGLRVQRALSDLLRPPQRLRRLTDSSAFTQTAAFCVSPLWSDVTGGERALEQGKVHNLRRAASRLDGILIPAGTPFSFWSNVGRASRRRGYATGRMLREGCMVTSIGGGLCQLSNALYQTALDAGCGIIERHAHSKAVPGSSAEAGRDATVAWNYIDLRFAADRDLLLRVRLDAASLNVSLHAVGTAAIDATSTTDSTIAPLKFARSCATCGETECFRHQAERQSSSNFAYVVDGAWPELRDYVSANRRPEDVIALPLDGNRWGLARYSWETEGFAQVIEAPLGAARRALAWRTTSPQGAARRSAEVRSSAAIAAALGRRLSPETTHLTIAQSLAPFLWRDGCLGGRTFDVMMNRLPIPKLQARLDAAFAAHPEHSTLADYRAPDWLADAEAEVLAAAERIITPHTEIAGMFADRAMILGWMRPAPSVCKPSCGIVAFPGPTVARKGAYEVRAAARSLGFPLRPLGAELEGRGFWTGVDLEPTSVDGHWLDGAAVVVQPALVEESPRRLLEALECGVPVIATLACGLPPQWGLTLVPADDPRALSEAIVASLAAAAPGSTAHPVESRL